MEIAVVRGTAAESAYNLLANSPAIYVSTEYNDAKLLRLHFIYVHNASREYYFMNRVRKK